MFRFKDSYDVVTTALENVVELRNDESVFTAKGFLMSIHEFEFVLMMVMIESVSKELYCKLHKQPRMHNSLNDFHFLVLSQKLQEVNVCLPSIMIQVGKTIEFITEKADNPYSSFCKVRQFF